MAREGSSSFQNIRSESAVFGHGAVWLQDPMEPWREQISAMGLTGLEVLLDAASRGVPMKRINETGETSALVTKGRDPFLP